jgi:hypothetical protein
MSVNYRTLSEKLRAMEKSENFQYTRLVEPNDEQVAIHDAVMETIEDLRAWMEEA